jgi:hypothetical protein
VKKVILHVADMPLHYILVEEVNRAAAPSAGNHDNFPSRNPLCPSAPFGCRGLEPPLPKNLAVLARISFVDKFTFVVIHSLKHKAYAKESWTFEDMRGRWGIPEGRSVNWVSAGRMTLLVEGRRQRLVTVWFTATWNNVVYFIPTPRMSKAMKDNASNAGKVAGKCFTDSSNHNFWALTTVMPEWILMQS